MSHKTNRREECQRQLDDWSSEISNTADMIRGYTNDITVYAGLLPELTLEGERHRRSVQLIMDVIALYKQVIEDSTRRISQLQHAMSTFN